MKILIVDDDIAVCSSIRLLLKRANWNSHSLHRPQEVMPYLRQHTPDLILLDMNFTIETSGRKGLEMLHHIRSEHPKIPIILMTGWATVQLAVEGMKAGARDFIAKPWDNSHLLRSIQTILDLEKKEEEKKEKNKTNSSIKDTFAHIIGQSPALQRVLQIAQKVSKTNASVLITGESGTGKELIAEAIHYASLRSEKPFIKVNLGGISTSLFESELFGHKRGAFTDAIADRKGRFELANGGTIFLDEIGDLALNSQVKLLRVLQEQAFEVLGSSQTQKTDVRVISATNKNLEEMIAAGSFREDLYYRINLIKIHLPALRERPDDIPLLVEFYLQNLRQTYDSPDLTIAPEALDWLKMQHFSGNVRQLRNLVERVFLISTAAELTLRDFQQQYHNDSTPSSALPEIGKVSLEEMEILMIKKALFYHDNNISLAAKSLGITRNALYRRIEKYEL